MPSNDNHMTLPAMADRQLPRDDETFLDHIGMFVLDPAVGAAALERLGFLLTPYCVQTNPARDGGAPVPTGTANRCAMFERGYLELLSPTTETPLSVQLRAAVARYPGLHLAAFSTDDTDRIFDQLTRAGFAPGPAVDLRREVETDDGPATLRFSVVRVPPESMDEGRIQFLRHHTAALLWEDKWLHHPNGAVALTDLLIVVADLDEVTDRYVRFLGQSPIRSRDFVVFNLPRGRITIARPAFYQTLAAMPALPGLPFMAACAIEVADIDKTKSALSANDVMWHEGAGRQVIATLPGNAMQTAFAFIESSGTPHWLA